MNNPNYVLCCYLGVCDSCELLHQSPEFICSEGSRVLIGGSPPDHPLQSLDHLTATHGWPRGNRQMARQALALYRHRRISVRWHGDHRAVIERRLPDLRAMTCGFFPLHFGRWPPDRRSMIGRCPTGRCRMRKSGEESADHPANFNCELNLPGDRRMSAGWVLNRRITARFLQDSSQGSPHGDLAIGFALLWRSY